MFQISHERGQGWVIVPVVFGLLTLGGCMGSKDTSSDLASADLPSAEVPGSKGSSNQGSGTVSTNINNQTKFSAKEFGVKGSPRITTLKRPRKGGGRYQIGKPYKIRGNWYTPKDQPGLKQTGLASWYGPNFHGRLTANGEIYDQYSLSAAHPTMPLPSYAHVTNLENGRRVMVRVNDRGPYAHNRVIDLSARAAELLGYTKQGVAKVKVEYIGKARMDGLDEQKLMASYVGPAQPTGTRFSAPGTMMAMNEPRRANRPAAAITQGFGTSNVGLSGNVPIPTVRPTLFEGIPILRARANTAKSSLEARIEQVVFRPKSNLGSEKTPLAYGEAIDLVDEYAFAPELNTAAFKGEFANRLVVINVGVLPDASGQHMLKRLLGNHGIMKTTENSAVTLSVREEQVNHMLDYLQDIGLISAHIE